MAPVIATLLAPQNVRCMAGGVDAYAACIAFVKPCTCFVVQICPCLVAMELASILRAAAYLWLAAVRLMLRTASFVMLCLVSAAHR